MIEFNHFEKAQQNFLNGKIAQFMDAYIRQHKVWTPLQMLLEFKGKIESELDSGVYLPDPRYAQYDTEESKYISKRRLEAVKWLTTISGSKFCHDRFQKKYLKHRPVADRKSPIVERVRFGLKWDENFYYDINFGLKDQYRFKDTIELENIKYAPWSVEHVNSELEEKYDCTIKTCFNKLSTSFLEEKFVRYWIDNYYSNLNPCLIPEVCGFRANFFYFSYKDNIYSQKTEIREKITSPLKSINFRYDFLLANFKQQKIAFIELDGFDYHKTRQQQTIDSIKRNTASKNDVTLYTFTSKRINEDIEAVFSELEPMLT